MMTPAATPAETTDTEESSCPARRPSVQAVKIASRMSKQEQGNNTLMVPRRTTANSMIMKGWHAKRFADKFKNRRADRSTRRKGLLLALVGVGGIVGMIADLTLMNMLDAARYQWVGGVLRVLLTINCVALITLLHDYYRFILLRKYARRSCRSLTPGCRLRQSPVESAVLSPHGHASPGASQAHNVSPKREALHTSG